MKTSQFWLKKRFSLSQNKKNKAAAERLDNDKSRRWYQQTEMTDSDSEGIMRLDFFSRFSFAHAAVEPHSPDIHEYI